MIEIDHEFVPREPDSPYCGHWNNTTRIGSEFTLKMGIQCGYPRANESVHHKGEPDDRG